MMKSFFFKLFNIVDYEFNDHEKKIFDYFKEVALKAEFGHSPNRVIKWAKPMKIFIKKEKEFNSQIVIIEKTIREINDLTTDGFKIELTDNLKESNTILYLHKRKKVAEMDPFFFKGINEDFVGLASVEFDLDNYNIINGKIFIDTNESLKMQKSTIIEEITQSIGLMNDSERYSESTFYQYKGYSSEKYMEYSEIDKELIKLLYLPSMKSGKNERQVEKIMKRHYKSLKK